jgi:hypothetical protein
MRKVGNIPDFYRLRLGAHIASGQYIITNIIKNEKVESAENPPDK